MFIFNIRLLLLVLLIQHILKSLPKSYDLMDSLPIKIQSIGGGVGDKVDRLSSLPDDILHYILSISGLQIFDLVELSVLSNRWNHLWITMPYLEIDINSFYHARLSHLLFDNELMEKFRSFINWVLIRQGESRLVRLRLCSRGIFNEVQILRWLRAVAERNVQELDIKFKHSGGFSLPLFIAVNDSLTILKLTLETNFVRFPDVVRMNQLRSLELNEIEFTDSDLLQKLFSGCCSLESLRLKKCVGQNFSFLEFSSTCLKELIFDFLDHVDFLNFEMRVSCPNLIDFKYSAPIAMNCILANVYSLETVLIDWVGSNFEDGHKVGQMCHGILKEVHNVIVLILHLNVVNSLSYVLDELIRHPTSFPKVKSLSLSLGTLNNFTHVMFLLLDQCPNLEVFTLVSEEFEEGEWDEEQWELQLEGIVSWKSHPHLKAIKFVDFRGDEYELDFLRFLLENARSLEKLDIIWWTHSKIDMSVEIIDKVLMFPKASSGIVVTFLNANPDD